MTFSGLTETGGTNTAVEFYTMGSGCSTQYKAPWTPDLYPRLHLLPNGKVFYSGAQTTSKLFDPSTTSWNTNVARTNYSGTRTYGTSVLLPLDPATNGSLSLNADLFDLSTVDLNSNPPNLGTVSSAGANATQRLYHSVALLLPDATVWVAGGNPSRGTYNKTMEIYQPPYLFKPDSTLAMRPAITSAPSSISYGNSFSVTTADAANISSVVLVRNGAVTHAFGMDQREVGLSFTVESGALTVTAPPNRNIAPPGLHAVYSE